MRDNARSFDQRAQEVRQETGCDRREAAQAMPVCNCCGRPIPVYPFPDAGEYVEITKKWGYFSGKDGETHCFRVCESCYDAWVATFAIAPEVSEDTELV